MPGGIEDTKMRAQEFFKQHAADLEGGKDAGFAMTDFVSSIAKVEESTLQAAIAIMAEQIGLMSTSDSGAGLEEKIKDVFSSSSKEREKEGQTLASAIAKNREEFRSNAIEQGTLLGAGI